MTKLTLAFYAPTAPLSINKAKGRHWAANARLLEPWRDMALVMVRKARNRGDWPPPGTAGLYLPVTVQVELPFRTNTRRDPHNYTGTVVKAVVDGLKMGGLVPDDTAEWITVVDPALVIQPDKTRPLAARVIITPRSLT